MRRFLKPENQENQVSESDFHKRIVVVMKSYSPKRTGNIVTYLKYTNIDKDKLIDKISFNLPKHNLQELTLEVFISIFKIIFEKQTSPKEKYLRANHSKFVAKELSEAMIKIRSKLDQN